LFYFEVIEDFCVVMEDPGIKFKRKQKMDRGWLMGAIALSIARQCFKHLFFTAARIRDPVPF
jgi:hypothetical protein